MSELDEEIEVHDNQRLEGHLFSDDECHGRITWSTVYPEVHRWIVLLQSTFSILVTSYSHIYRTLTHWVKDY
jgi:hypothetical protein